jgi:hypothetical protein
MFDDTGVYQTETYRDQISILVDFNVVFDMDMYIFEGSLEVKLPTIWTVEKQR